MPFYMWSSFVLITISSKQQEATYHIIWPTGSLSQYKTFFFSFLSSAVKTNFKDVITGLAEEKTKQFSPDNKALFRWMLIDFNFMGRERRALGFCIHRKILNTAGILFKLYCYLITENVFFFPPFICKHCGKNSNSQCIYINVWLLFNSGQLLCFFLTKLISLISIEWIIFINCIKSSGKIILNNLDVFNCVCFHIIPYMLD